MFSNVIPVDKNNKAQLDRIGMTLRGFNITLEQFLEICELNGAVVYEKLQPEGVRFTDFSDLPKTYNPKELNELCMSA